jgi:uncharacterized membrane protein
MSRNEFMKKLENLLSDIPLDEKEEALQYYNNYFDDAGEEHEDEIIKELGSPERVASIIKAELDGSSSNQETRGYFDEKGYQDTILMDEKYEIVDPAQEEQDNTSKESYSYSDNQQSGSQNSFKQQDRKQNGYEQQDGYKKNTNIGLILLLCILAIPVGIPAIATIFGITVAILASLAALFIGFGVGGLVMMGVGTALIIAGIIKLGIPFIGFLLCGAGLLSLGIGMLLVMVTIFIGKTVFPAIVRGFVNICRMPFKNRSVAV